ncbi:hypothetical protein IAD21_04959 [Abditibacteriota bacterium]|nr:hypothetical protein IAD21_04959 [Abditibacteriota bacterium]
MKRLGPLCFLVVAVAGVGYWKWNSPRFDVVFDAPPVTLDTLNNGLPLLALQLRTHTKANTFCVRYSVVPEPTNPSVSLPRRLEYNRAQKRMDWHRDTLWIDRYDGATDAIIERVAGQNGGIRKLIRSGCTRSLPPESKTFGF